MCVIEAGEQLKNEVRARKNILGVAAIHGVTGEDRVVAEILHAVIAVPAIAVDAAHPGNADARSHWQFVGRAVDYFSDDLMARNKTWPKRWKISFDDVKVSPTHSACDDPKQKMPGFELWTWDILDVKERSRRCTL